MKFSDKLFHEEAPTEILDSVKHSLELFDWFVKIGVKSVGSEDFSPLEISLRDGKVEAIQDKFPNDSVNVQTEMGSLGAPRGIVSISPGEGYELNYKLSPIYRFLVAINPCKYISGPPNQNRKDGAHSHKIMGVKVLIIPEYQ